MIVDSVRAGSAGFRTLRWWRRDPASGDARITGRPLSDAEIAANVRHPVLDTTWSGIFAGAPASYLPVYVVRLGASPFMIGAITFGPALVSIFWQLPAGHLVDPGRSKEWTVVGGLLFRSSSHEDSPR